MSTILKRSIYLLLALLLFSANALAKDLVTLRLAVFADKDFSEIMGSEAQSSLEEIVTKAATLMSRDLNIKIIPVIIVTSDLNFPGTALEEFQHMTTTHYAGVADLFHLVKGKGFGLPSLGYSYQSSLCKRPGYEVSVSQLSSMSLSALTIAHELGHAIGAEHVSTGIMSKSMNLDTVSRFTKVSRNQIHRYLKSTTRCLKSKQKPQVSAFFINQENPALATIALGGELKNCSLELNYLGQNKKQLRRFNVEKNIYYQKLNTLNNNLSASLTCAGKLISTKTLELRD